MALSLLINIPGKAYIWHNGIFFLIVELDNQI